jgi:hypothetical protein
VIEGGNIAGTIDQKTPKSSEHVSLKGALKGDDGKGVGPLRVGAFTYQGRVGIERIAIEGKVDEAWLKKQHEDLIKAETGPE